MGVQTVLSNGDSKIVYSKFDFIVKDEPKVCCYPLFLAYFLFLFFSYDTEHIFFNVLSACLKIFVSLKILCSILDF